MADLRAADPAAPTRARDARAVAVGGGVLLAALLVTQLYLWINLWPVRIDWPTAVVWSLPQLYLWLLLLPVVWWATGRFPLDRGRRALRLAGHLGASFATALSALLLLDGSDRLLGWSRALGAPGSLLSSLKYTLVHLHLGVAAYWVVLAARHALAWAEQSRAATGAAAELRDQLADARLHALRMQLQPHFLFNTLNAIDVLMRHDVPRAREMLRGLADLLRIVLEGEATQEIPLRRELEFARAYLAIEATRFGDRLTVSETVDPDVLDALVPNFVLQPLVENAVRHGVASRAAPGHIAVRARRAGARVELEVVDDGPGPDAPGEPGTGVGLANTRRRLAQLYGAAAALTLEPAPGGGARCSLTLPHRDASTAPA